MSEISEAARAKVQELWKSDGPDAFNRFVQQVSDAAKEVDEKLAELGWREADHTARGKLTPFILPDPVDPLLIEAREIVANYEPIPHASRSDPLDHTAEVQIALAALKRGMELAQ